MHAFIVVTNPSHPTNIGFNEGLWEPPYKICKKQIAEIFPDNYYVLVPNSAWIVAVSDEPDVLFAGDVKKLLNISSDGCSGAVFPIGNVCEGYFDEELWKFLDSREIERPY